MNISIDERIIVGILLVVLIILSLYFVTPRSDNYFHYYVSREILRDPSFLWKPENSTRMFVLSLNEPVFFYPPLTLLIYAFLILLNLPPMLLIIISTIIVIHITYKINKKAVFLLFISFLFIRSVVQGEYDIFLVAVTMLSVYFFEKRPLLSGFLVGLTTLISLGGFLIVGCYILYILVYKKNEMFKKDFYRNKYFISIIIVLLTLTPWYLRNYILFNGDITGTFIGKTMEDFFKSEQILRTAFQSNQPETRFLDTTGYYPTPIDLLFTIGIIFFVYNVIKKKKLEFQQLLILVFSAIYIICQIFDLRMFMGIRHYLPIFPLLAMEIVKGINEKYFKYVLVISLIIFIYFASTLQKYAWNDSKTSLEQICPQVKSQVDMEPVYVEAFQHLFLGYTCDLNMADLNNSVYIINFTDGTIKKRIT